MKLTGLWVLWSLVFLWQEFAGDWYYTWGPTINAGLSLLCMIAVLSAFRARWATLYGFTCIAQIYLNVIDSAVILEENTFNFWAGGLNTL